MDAVLEEKNEVISLGISDQKISELRAKYFSLIISDNKTADAARQARTEVRTYRTSVGKVLKEINQPYKDIIALNKKEADRIVALLREIEDSVQEKIDAWDKKKAEEKAERERVEAERIAKHQSNINQLRTLSKLNFSDTADAVQFRLDQLQEITIDGSYEEFQIEAAEIKDQGINTLGEALSTLREREAAEKQRQKEAEEMKQLKQEHEKLQQQIASQQPVSSEPIAGAKADSIYIDDIGCGETWSEAELNEAKAINEKIDSCELTPDQVCGDVELIEDYLVKVQQFARENAPNLVLEANKCILKAFIDAIDKDIFFAL